MSDITTRRWLCRGLTTIGATLLATTVSAQASDTVRMPVWEASGSVAMQNIRASELDGGQDYLYDYWESQLEPGVQVGRYITKQLKVEIGVRGPMQYSFYESDYVPAPGIPGGVPESIDRSVRVLSFAPAITWQFFENSFVHPYVSAGVAMDVSDIHRFRQAGTGSWVQSRTTVQYDVPGVDTRATAVDARPFLAVGTKLWTLATAAGLCVPRSRWASEVAHRPGIAALRRRCGLNRKSSGEKSWRRESLYA